MLFLKQILKDLPTLVIIWFQKISIPPPQRVIENTKEEGGLKWNFYPSGISRGMGVQTKKTLCGGSMVIFLYIPYLSRFWTLKCL